MTRYTTRASVSIEDDVADYRGDRCAIDVIEPHDRAVNTGLVDASGITIYRVTDRVPMGFCRG